MRWSMLWTQIKPLRGSARTGLLMGQGNPGAQGLGKVIGRVCVHDQASQDPRSMSMLRVESGPHDTRRHASDPSTGPEKDGCSDKFVLSSS